MLWSVPPRARHDAGHRESHCHSLMGEVASVVVEETHARCCVAGFEETDDLREEREGAGVVVGSGDEAEPNRASAEQG
jgi:hypothetical protein